MRDVLCIYYSRTGNTKKVMKAIASEMDAELVELTDGIERSGLRGWLRSGLDAVKKDCPEAAAIETERKLENYRLVIIGTPVWAGRCSSVVRSFLKQHGKELNRVCIRADPQQRSPQKRGCLPSDGPLHGTTASGGNITPCRPCGPYVLAGGIFAAAPGSCWSQTDSRSLFPDLKFEKRRAHYAGKIKGTGAAL